MKKLNKNFKSVNFFEADSFNLALYGVNGEYGLLDIIDIYSSSPAGNLANYYAGISFLNIGDNESAVDYLSAFSSDDEVVSSIAIGSMGDAYMNMGEFEDAIKFWTKAAFNSENNFTKPLYLKEQLLHLKKKVILIEQLNTTIQLKETIQILKMQEILKSLFFELS